jgi:4-alpha-glucanotransferase
MGASAFDFVDFLAYAGQKYWQVLPVHPTGFGDSPYQSFSTFAGNPYFIDLDILCENGLLLPDECESMDWGEDPGRVDFEKVYHNKYEILRKAFKRGFDAKDPAYVNFCKENNRWLSDYAVFMAAKQVYGMRAWKDWEDEGLRLHEESALEDFISAYQEETDFYFFMQFLFFNQWDALKRYANSRGVSIIGDIPIYVAADSADAWANRELFSFDKNNECENVAGCPPDFFSHEGQYWGNPVYNWEYLTETRYEWWIHRLAGVFRLFDVVRIDHFRGFESFYSIDYGAESARFGRWEKGPGIDFFREVKKQLPDLSIIAEDLGFLTEDVRLLLKQTGYPGMKVLQFAFDSGSANEYLPHNYKRNCVVYTGTHDNNTIAGWMEDTPEREVNFAIEYGALTAAEGYNWGMIRLAFASVADLAIAPLQDFLNLSSSARMNTPSTIGDNWQWRVLPGYGTGELAWKIRKITELYGRL